MYSPCMFIKRNTWCLFVLQECRRHNDTQCVGGCMDMAGKGMWFAGSRPMNPFPAWLCVRCAAFLCEFFHCVWVAGVGGGESVIRWLPFESSPHCWHLPPLYFYLLLPAPSVSTLVTQLPDRSMECQINTCLWRLSSKRRNLLFIHPSSSSSVIFRMDYIFYSRSFQPSIYSWTFTL